MQINQGAPYDVTIAMPTRDAGPPMRRILEIVLAQETDKRVEFFAVDSGSSDDTRELLEKFHIPIVDYPREGFNWGSLREFCYARAQGRIIINLSQDAVPARTDWLENLIRPLDDPKVGVSSGSSIPDPKRHFPQFPWERNGYFYFTREIKKFTTKYGRGVSFGNSAVPRTVWEALHFDKQATGEDFQFQMKLHAAGYATAFPEDAPVLHHHNYQLKPLFRRCRNEGFALKGMGCPYNEWDLLADLLSPRKYVQWLRELKRGSLESPADILFPVVRPIAVYCGSRFLKEYVWY